MKQENLNRNLAAATACGALALAALAGCGEKAEENGGDAVEAGPDPRIEAVLLENEPEDAIPVGKARKQARPGETITVTGRIAGTMSPFTEGYAAVVLVDDEIETCERIPGDECPTPWDACCEDPKKLQAMRLTVRVTGEQGMPVATGLKGVAGMKELDTLVVTGVVTDDSTDENLVLDATGIFRKS